MRRYVIIGNGIAAANCIEGIRSLDCEGSITVVSGEDREVYCRPLISYLLDGRTDQDRMKYRDPGFYSRMGCEVLYGRKAVSIDKDSRRVVLDDKTQLPYDALCVAAGSYPFAPHFDGLDKIKKKFSFTTLDDALALEKAIDRESKVLIVGAGMIGLKCAECLAERVAEVTVCDLADHLLPTFLDFECASYVQKPQSALLFGRQRKLL